MASFLNKLSNSITNTASSVIGRENATKLANSINKVVYSAKYRDILKPGNVVQLISRTSHMSVQICASPNDLSRLIILGNGQIGPDHRNSHFSVIKEPKHGHFKFQNGPNFFAMDEPNGIPCVLAEPTGKKPKKHEFIRARNEFRIHEVIGSEEWFSLESVYFPGKYVAITPDGSITTVVKNKADETTHFCLHLIYEHPSNVKANRPQTSRNSTLSSSSSSQTLAAGAATASSASADVTSIHSHTSDTSYSYQSEQSRRKQEESERYAREQEEADRNQQYATSSYSSPPEDTTPPAYGNLFPTLPK